MFVSQSSQGSSQPTATPGPVYLIHSSDLQGQQTPMWYTYKHVGKTLKVRSWEDGSGVKSADLTENLGLDASTIWWLTTTYKSSFTVSDALFWPPRAPAHTWCLCTHSDAITLAHKVNI